MGTQWKVILYAEDKARADEAAKAAFGAIAAVDAAMSDYKPESELSRLNAAAGQGPRPVSAPLFEVLGASQRIAALSDGAFDVTVGPAVQLWRRMRKSGKMATPEEIREAASKAGYASLVLDPASRTARLEKPGMKIDLGGIAKGYASDRAIAALAALGIQSALVDGGGGMTLGDPPPGAKGWTVRLYWEPEKVLIASRCGISTSGDVEQFVEIDGRRFSHILDPKTGLGLEERRMVTVVAPDGMTADALSTALSVMGPDRGLKLAEELPETETWYRWKSGEKVQAAGTSGFAALLREP